MGGTASKQKGRTSSKQSQLEIADRPSPPGKPQLVPGTPSSEPDVVTISWEPSKFDGGSKITGYLVEHRRTGSPHWVRASPILVRQPELTLSGLEPGWRYQFRVSAKNAVGYSEPGELSELLTVTLQRSAASAPHFVKELKDTVALENEKAELSVQVKGTPPPTIAWYKDGLEIYSSRRQKILTENDTSTLLFYQAALSDEGEIKCTATNRVGHAVTRARLRLEAPPSIRLPRQYEEGLIFEKDEVIRLRVAVVGRPVPDVAWIHNGEVLPHGGRFEIGHSERHASLRIGEARRSDRGEYQVRAFNKLGEDVASFLVTVTDRPMPPGKARVAMTLGRTVTLSWSTPDDDGGCKIGNYIVEYFRIGWDMWLKAATCRQLSTTLGDLIEGSEYKFRVKAENPYGVSDPSEESDVVFIPDPKRGLLEPPERGTASLDSTYAIEQWLDERKRPLATTFLHDNSFIGKKKKKDHELSIEGEKKPPVGQNLTKSPAITNFKSFHSEDSMSPTVTPEPQEPVETKTKPIVPKRKAKSEKTVLLNEANDEKVSSEINYRINDNIDEEGKGLEILETNKWKNVMPRDGDDMLHGSSEMMLVLLPNSRAATEERDYLRKSDFFTSLEESGAVAPPMSLSAPELGYEDALEFPPIRSSVSSSELLHQRTMSRFYQDINEEEYQCSLKRRTSIERRRSFERRSSSKGRDLTLPVIKDESLKDTQEPFDENAEIKKLFTSKIDNLNEEYNGNNASNRQKRPLWANTSSKESFEGAEEYLKKERLVAQSSEEDMEYEEDYSEDEDERQEEFNSKEIKYAVNEEAREEEEDFEDDYDDEESDNYNISESEDGFRHSIPFEEDTYHPRNMIPKINISDEPKKWTEINKNDQYNSLVSREKNELFSVIPEHKPISPSDLKTNNETILLISKQSQNTSYPENMAIINNQSQFGSHENDMISLPVNKTDKKLTPTTSSIKPKPILKVRDHSQERSLEQVSKRGKHQAPIANVEAELNIISKAVSDNVLSIVSRTSGNGVKLRKKTVRIEEPVEMMFVSSENIENEMGISAGEVARNRRRRSGSLGEEADPLKTVISHYSDIVAEFGKAKRGSTARYLNYEELRAAAQTDDLHIERTITQNKEQSENRTKIMEDLSPLTRAIKITTPLQVQCVSEVAEKPVISSEKPVISSENPVNSSEKPDLTTRRYTVTERKMRSFFDFMMDLVLFLVACWLYAFKDERLAIPILLLMIYRQTFEAIKRRLPSKWRRK